MPGYNGNHNNSNNSYNRGNDNPSRGHSDKNDYNGGNRGGSGGNETDGGSVLDSIRECSRNIETFTNKQTFDLKLDEELKKISNRERIIRESTIMVKNTDRVDYKYIYSTIEKEWSDNGKMPPTFWNDKSHTFIQFANKQDKIDFISQVRSGPSNGALGVLNGLIAKENRDGHHFTRREVKIELLNIREQVKAEKIEGMLKGLAKEHMFISEIKKGKLHGLNGRQSRSLMFKVNGGGFDLIFGQLNGIIPYSSPDDNITIKLWPRVNVRPWSCRDCYFIGPNHSNCPGLCPMWLQRTFD